MSVQASARQIGDGSMKIKPRYIVICALLCVAALAISIGMFYVEMGLAHWMKYNDALSKWHQTSTSEMYNGGRINTNFMVTQSKTLKEANARDVAGLTIFPYMGKTTVVTGNVTQYGTQVMSRNVAVYGEPENVDNSARSKDEIGLGSRFTVYYKPDEPAKIATKVRYMQYIVVAVVLVALTAALILAARFFNRKLNENTFGDSVLNIMDIPAAVVIIGMILGFFLGMLIGNLSVGSEYTDIKPGIVAAYESGDREVT